MTMEDNETWIAHITGTGGIIPMLNKRLFLIRRLRNKINTDCLRKVAESIYTSKIRYGLQLCSKIRWSEQDPKEGIMKDLQKTQNKLLRFLNKSKLEDKMPTK